MFVSSLAPQLRDVTVVIHLRCYWLSSITAVNMDCRVFERWPCLPPKANTN